MSQLKSLHRIQDYSINERIFITDITRRNVSLALTVPRRFQVHLFYQDIFLVAITGYALPEDLKKAYEAGFDRHLAKPVELTTLEQTLAQAQVNFNVS